MFEKATSAIRHTTGNRFTPCISLLLSAASFVLTILVVFPATRRGKLENFHLITLNTSNVGQDVVNFTPATNLSKSVTQLAIPLKEEHRKRLTTGTIPQPSSASNTTYGNLTTTNASTTTIIVSLPTETQAPTPANLESFLSGLIQSFGTGEDSQLGNFLKQMLTDITSSIVRNLSKKDGDLGLLFGDIIQNITAQTKEEISKAGAPVLEQVLQGLISSSHDGSLSNYSLVNDFFDGVLGNFSTGLSEGISRAQGTAALGIANALGIQQLYTMHLRQICSGTLSSRTDPKASFEIFGCFTYEEAASAVAKLMANIPSSTTVLSTNISIPALSQVNETVKYITSLANTLSKTIFSFYILSAFGSGAIIIGSLLGFLFPASLAVMYSNLAFSILSSFASLAGSATVTAFITTAYNIINIFGSSLGLGAGLGSPFLILTWASFGLTLFTNWYILGVWFFQFRTIEVRVQRHSPQFNVPPMSPQRLTEAVEISGDMVPTLNTINTFNSKGSFNIRRGSKRQSQYADF